MRTSPTSPYSCSTYSALSALRLFNVTHLFNVTLLYLLSLLIVPPLSVHFLQRNLCQLRHWNSCDSPNLYWSMADNNNRRVSLLMHTPNVAIPHSWLLFLHKCGQSLVILLSLLSVLSRHCSVERYCLCQKESKGISCILVFDLFQCDEILQHRFFWASVSGVVYEIMNMINSQRNSHRHHCESISILTLKGWGVSYKLTMCRWLAGI